MGRVKSLNYNHTKKPNILKQSLNIYGYPRIVLCKNANHKPFSVHVLVAKAFIPNPQNKPTVDHINTIRTDNRVKNLRWFTIKEQVNNNEITSKKVKERTREMGKKYVSRAIDASKRKVKCTTTGKIFDSITEAYRYYGMKRGRIYDCCVGKRNYCGKLPDGTKLQWEYID